MIRGLLLACLIILMISVAASALPTGYVNCPNPPSNTIGGPNNSGSVDGENYPRPPKNFDRPIDYPGDNRTPCPIPEPATLLLLGIGALGMSAYRKIRK